jgi:hypothetical protein
MISFALIAGCAAQSATTTDEEALHCNADADCTSTVGGGRCTTAHLCHADNECTTNAACPSTSVCVRSSVFGGHGLCTLPNTAPEPTPAGACSTTNACPPGEACASDGRCHAKFCITDAQCPNDEVCHPQCTLTSTVPFGICEPPGVPIQVCPPSQIDPPSTGH